MANINTYAVINHSAWSSPNTLQFYRTCELRETANYLIDDKDGNRYKKVDSSDYVAQLYHKSSHRYSRSTDRVYLLGSDVITQINESNKRIRFMDKVRCALSDLEPKTYEAAIEVAKMIGVEE